MKQTSSGITGTFSENTNEHLMLDVPTCKILGVDVAAVNMSWLCSYIENGLNRLSGNYLCFTNVFTAVTAFENPDYLQVQNGGALALPDGGPLSFVGRRRGYKKMARTTGPDFLHAMLQISTQKGYRHFFYGSTHDTLEKMRKKLVTDYPDVAVVGMYAPPFRDLTADEDFAIEEMINRAKPDFIWVGLGAPKQENWMAAHKGKLNGLMVGVGAAFDYFAGNITRAPLWMQNHSLEWLHRLRQEPKRLWSRYLTTNYKFIRYVIFQKK